MIELFSPNYLNEVYWTLADQVKLRYNYVLGESPHAPGTERKHDNISIDVGKVRAAIDNAP